MKLCNKVDNILMKDQCGLLYFYSSSLSPARSFLPGLRRHAEKYFDNNLQNDCNYWDNKERHLLWQK